MNRQPSLELAIGQAVAIMINGKQKTGFIKEREYTGCYTVQWDDDFGDTREHIGDLIVIAEDD